MDREAGGICLEEKGRERKERKEGKKEKEEKESREGVKLRRNEGKMGGRRSEDLKEGGEEGG